MIRSSIRSSHALVVLCLCAVMAAAIPGTAGVPPDGRQDAGAPRDVLCVMTYNLRYASSESPNAWPVRRPLIRECIQSVSPDLIGTQEGLYGQLRELAADLPEYDWIGLGREGGSRGEFMAVFYRKSRLEPLAYDHFWLSDTPGVAGSATWGTTHPRMVTWVRFLDRQTRREFYFFNTHLDNAVSGAREKSALLIRQRVEALNTSLPILLAGDFNVGPVTNSVYTTLTGGRFFADTWSLAKTRRGDGLGTFNDFTEVPKNGERIDWILVRGQAAVDAAEVVTFSRDGQFPSDHCPVAVRLRLE